MEWDVCRIFAVRNGYVLVIYEEQVVVVDMNERDKRERVIQRNKRGGEYTVRKSKEVKGKKGVKRRGRRGMDREGDREKSVPTTVNSSRQQQQAGSSSRGLVK